MKKSGWIVHAVYLLVIVTQLVFVWWLQASRSRAKDELWAAEEQVRSDLQTALGRLCAELSGDLYSAAEADTEQLYLKKLIDVQNASGQALLLLTENGRQTPWLTFWQSLKRYTEGETEATLERESPPEDRENLRLLAELCAWLGDHPQVLLDETGESLPEDLKLPTLQTAYAVDEKTTRRAARRALGVSGGLKELTGGPPGVRSYGCKNARVDVLQSGELLYLYLQLEKREGDIGQDAAAQAFSEFAMREGFGKTELLDLYEEDGLYWATLAPLTRTAELGRIPDLDRTLRIACTGWSGKVCYFSAGNYFTPSEYAGNHGLVSESKIEAAARKKGARIGGAFLYRGRICRPLIYERIGFAGRAVLCLDASTAKEVDLFYAPHARYGERSLY